MHVWQRGLKHAQYTIPLAGQQCERVHLSVKISSTPSGTLVRATKFFIACNKTSFNPCVVIRVLDMVPGKRKMLSCIESSHLNFKVRNGNTYGHALCMGYQDELFQIGREQCHTSLSQHTTQNFLSRLHRGKCQKQITRLLDTGTGSVATTMG